MARSDFNHGHLSLSCTKDGHLHRTRDPYTCFQEITRTRELPVEIDQSPSQWYSVLDLQIYP